MLIYSNEVAWIIWNWKASSMKYKIKSEFLMNTRCFVRPFKTVMVQLLNIWVWNLLVVVLWIYFYNHEAMTISLDDLHIKAWCRWGTTTGLCSTTRHSHIRDLKRLKLSAAPPPLTTNIDTLLTFMFKLKNLSKKLEMFLQCQCPTVPTPRVLFREVLIWGWTDCAAAATRQFPVLSELSVVCLIVWHGWSGLSHI